MTEIQLSDGSGKPETFQPLTVGLPDGPARLAAGLGVVLGGGSDLVGGCLRARCQVSADRSAAH